MFKSIFIKQCEEKTQNWAKQPMGFPSRYDASASHFNTCSSFFSQQQQGDDTPASIIRQTLAVYFLLLCSQT